MTTAVAYQEYDPFDLDGVRDPYPYYEALRAHAPVFRVPANGVWVVSRHHDVVEVLRRADLFTNEAMAGSVTRPAEYATADDGDEPPAVSIVGTDGEYHARLRRIVNRAFTPMRVAAQTPTIRRLTDRALDHCLGNGPFDVVSEVAVPVPVGVIADMLGVDAGRSEEFRRWSEAMIAAVFGSPEPEEREHISHCLDEMQRWLADVIDDRLEHPGADLISVLVRAEADEVLTRNEVQTFAFTLLVAGSVTTTNLVSNAILALLADDDLFDRIAGDPSLIPALVEETLRYDAPIQAMLRTAAGDVDVAGVTIPQGATVVPLIGSANRDGDVFADPNRFDIDRDNRAHTAFGHGVHFCLGAALARLEARVLFEELFARVRRIETRGPVERAPSFLLRGPTRLEIEAVSVRSEAC